jgi:hypothetical protein
MVVTYLDACIYIYAHYLKFISFYGRNTHVSHLYNGIQQIQMYRNIDQVQYMYHHLDMRLCRDR